MELFCPWSFFCPSNSHSHFVQNQSYRCLYPASYKSDCALTTRNWCALLLNTDLRLSAGLQFLHFCVLKSQSVLNRFHPSFLQITQGITVQFVSFLSNTIVPFQDSKESMVRVLFLLSCIKEQCIFIIYGLSAYFLSDYPPAKTGMDSLGILHLYIISII